LPRIISFTRSQDATSGKIFPDQPHKRVNQFLEIGARSVYGIFKWFLGIFAITAAAQIILTPVLLAIFHKAPTYSLLSNLIATPALTLALPLALISSGIGSLWPGLGAIILWPAVWFIELIIQTAEFFSTLPHSSIGVQSFAPALFLGTLTFSIAILWIVGRGQGSLKKPLACLFSIIVVIGTISLFTGKRNDFLEVVFLNVGRADCAYIGTPGGASILVDTGAKYSYFDAGESIVIPFLRYFDVKRLNSIIISHMQSDHAGGLESILRATRVDRIYVSPYCAAKKPIIGTSAKIVSASHKLEPFSVHGVKFSFLNSEKSSPIGATESDRLNNSSVVLKVEYQGASFLFTGDIELETEKRLLDMGDKLRCDALKVSHHGSASSSSEAFLRLANPRIAVISCSWPQKRQLPADSVMDRLEEACEHVYWTGRDGAISLRTDGKMIRIKPARGRAFEMAL
jgi:competence protein ComEC